MNSFSTVKVSIDLARIRENALAIIRLAHVPLIAVVKADAYGLGASQVAKAIGDLVHAFYVFDAGEAVTADLWNIAGKRTIALNGSWTDPADYAANHVSPVVWATNRATALRNAQPVLSIDTGQQRFACTATDIDAVREAGDCHEIMTHAVAISQVERFVESTDRWKTRDIFLHAAGSALLDQPTARLDAVRPGLALYRGAARVTARLIEVRDSTGPAGYTGFVVPRFGVILAGYTNGLKTGPCLVNGQLRRVIEVGMQSCFVELGPADRVDDEVVLLGQEIEVNEASVARAWYTSEQEVLVKLTKIAPREYCSG